jgi:hypothetical protein
VLSQSGFLSQSDFRLHFGLDTAAAVDAIEVVWPNGDLEKFPGVAAGRLAVLVEGSGVVKPWPR